MHGTVDIKLFLAFFSGWQNKFQRRHKKTGSVGLVEHKFFYTKWPYLTTTRTPNNRHEFINFRICS